MSKRNREIKSYHNAKLPTKTGGKFSNVSDCASVGFVVMDRDRGNILRPVVVYLTERKAEEFAFFQAMEKNRQCSVVQCTFQRNGSCYIIFGPKSKLYSGTVQFIS